MFTSHHCDMITEIYITLMNAYELFYNKIFKLIITLLRLIIYSIEIINNKKKIFKWYIKIYSLLVILCKLNIQELV